MNAHLTTLPNGLRIATCEMPHAQTAAAGLWAAIGGRHEPARLNGISHFIEHMLFKGTERRSARRIMEEIEGVGGDLNAFTSEERTCYYGAAAAEFFPRLCDVLCDMFLNARFAPSDIERERSVIGEEILMYRDEPASHVQEILNARFWAGHPLGRPLTGTLETVEGLSRPDFLAFRDAHYHTRNTVFTAAGCLRHEDVVTRVSRLLDALPRGQGKPTRIGPPPAPGRALRIVADARETQQTQLAMGFPASSHHDPRRYAVHILNIILGGNASSRLFQQLRERRGLCYSISTHCSAFEDSGMFNLSMGLDASNLQKALKLIRDELRRIASEPPRPSELRRAKEYAVGTSRMALERTSSQNMRAGTYVLVYGDILDPEGIHARLREVTAEEVSSAALDFLDPSAAAVAVVGPAPDTASIEQILSSGT
jgi:predicted Zn-dependent peptidase